MQTDFELIEEPLYPPEYANQDLKDAFELNYFKGIERALEDGADPNEESLLLLAVRNKNIKIAELLLKYKADPNEDGYNSETPLNVAIDNNDIEIVKLLLNHGTPTHGGDLTEAVKNNNIEMTELLLTHGARDDQDESIIEAVVNDNIEIVRLLLEYEGNPHVRNQENDNRSLLMIAIDKGNIEMVKLLLEHGAKPYGWDENKWTPLQIAINNNHSEIVKLLIDHGADTDEKGYLNKAYTTEQN